MNKKIFYEIKYPIKITNRNKTYYNNLGYLCDNNIEYVKLEHIKKGSNIKINVKCEYCGNENQITYKNFNSTLNKNNDIYYCSKCWGDRIKNKNFDKYGVYYPLQNEDIKNKQKNILIKKYNVDHPSKSDFLKYRLKNILLEKYNVDNVSKIDSVKNKKINTLKITSLDRIKYKYDEIINYDYDNKILKCQCDNGHNYYINYDLFYNRKEFNTQLCTICNPIDNHKSGLENQLKYFIKNNYQDEIIENDRHLGKELDIYLPNLKIAFEFNGLYWHNELNKPNNYHLKKTELCENNGIQLIHIYEDDWLNKQDVIKSMILNKLGKNPYKIYARKTEIREISDNKLIREFLNKNHIQGFVGSLVKIGLFYENELVSLMTFGKKRVAMGQKKINSNINNNDYELLRFCNKLNTNVIGGASKLFKYFINHYEYDNILTYADRSYSNGNLYKTLGFKYKGKTDSNYHYIVNNLRKYRFSFRKDILIKEGYDPSLTEHQIMLNRKIYRIYNSGNLIFNFNI